ncbi:TPA: hypothetical protein ACH3X1_009725 [Trebouxia sp. C0004]
MLPGQISQCSRLQCGARARLQCGTHCMAATHEARPGHMAHRAFLPRPMPGVNPCWHLGLGRTNIYSGSSRVANQQVAATNATNPSKSALARMPKDEIAEKATARGLDTEGNKQAIIDRLVAAYAEEQAQAEADSNSDGPVTYDDLMALPKIELQSQCAAVGLPKSKRTKEQLANSLLETMASGVASPQPESNAEAGSSNGEVPDQASLEGDGVTGGLGGYDVQRPTAAAVLDGINVDDAESVVSAYQKLVDLHKAELSQACSMLGLPKSHRTKAQMAESIVSHLQGNTSKPADIQATLDLPGTDALKTAQVPQSPPQPVERDANVKDVGIPTEGAGDQPMRQRQRLSPVHEDLENLNAEEPVGELGLDLPELNPKSARSAVADEDMDTDVDVVAQQRHTDRQAADFADQEDEVGDVRMDDILMLDEEPNPEYDVDEEQRPRLSRDADGDLTEANFGNDDETMGRLEDMGVAASGLVGDDVTRQNQGSAQRRRQASRVAAANIAEDEDDVYGSRATEARSPLASGSDEDDVEGEEGLASSEVEDLPMTAARGYGAEPFEGLQEPDGSEAFLSNAELADGFQISASSADGAALDEEDVESMSDGAGVTNEQYGKARKQTEKASGDAELDPGDSPPQPKVERGKPKGKRATPVPDYVSLSTVSSSSSPFPLKDGRADSQLADPSGLVDDMQSEGADADVSNDFAMPDWLAAKYNTTAKVMPPPAASPADPTPTPTPGTRVPTRMVAHAFKPVRRKSAQELMPSPVDQASEAAMLGQMPEAQQDLLASSSQDGTAGAPADMKAADLSDAQLTDTELDEAAGLSPQATAAMDTLLSSEGSPSPDPYSQEQTADTSLESGDLSPAEVDRDAQLSPEADALIDAGVAAVAPEENEQSAQDMPSISGAAEDDTHQLTDAEVSTQSFAGAMEAADPDSDQSIMMDAQLDPSGAITDSDFELHNGGSMSQEGLVEGLAASEAVMTDALAAAKGSVGKAQVEEQLKAISPKASEAPTSSDPESLAAHATVSTPMDTQQQSPQDLIDDLAASEAVMQDGLATAVDSLTGSASKAQQAAASRYSMDADIGDVSPPSSIPDGGIIEDDDLSDAAAKDLAAAAEEAAHTASPPAADESPDGSSTTESAPQEFLTSDPADSGPVSPPSSTPDGSSFSPSDDGWSDAAAAEEAAHSAAHESLDAEISGTHVATPQSFFGDRAAEINAVSPWSVIPDGTRFSENDISDAVAEDLAAAAADAAAQTSASSSDLQTDAGSHALDPDTQQGAEGGIGLVSAESSSNSVGPPLDLSTGIVSDLSHIQMLRSQVAAKQAALAALETQLGSTSASALHNRDQIQRLQLQMTELQDQHMAWQQSMLNGRLQELRAAAARVENNQTLKVDVQQQVQGMGDQLASLEASLQASDKQAGSLQQELASLGDAGPDPPAMKVNGRILNGASTHNLPQGYYFTLTDAPVAAEAFQAAAADGGGGISAQPQRLASLPDAEEDTQTDLLGDRAPLASSSSQPPTSSRVESQTTESTEPDGAQQQQRPQEDGVLESGRGQSQSSGNAGSSEMRASQPGMQYFNQSSSQSISLSINQFTFLSW